MPRCLPILTPFLDRLLIDFYLQLRSPDPLKPLFFLKGKTMFFQKIAFRSWHRFLFDFSANMLRFFLQKFPKILPKIDSKLHHFFDRFLHRFLEGSRRPQDRQDGPKKPPRQPKMPPRRPQEGPEKPSPPLIFRYWPLRSSKDPPGPLQH